MEKTIIKGKIMTLEEIFDESTMEIKYQIVLWFDDIPKLTLGDCEVIQ